MPRSLGAAMGGHTPAPAAPATPAGAPADDFDAFLAQETAKIQDMAKAKAKKKGIDLAPDEGEEGQGAQAAEAKPPRTERPAVILWAGAHGEQAPPTGIIKWNGPAGSFEIDRRIVATSQRTGVAGAFDVTVAAWRLEIVPHRFTPDVVAAVIDEWILREGGDWEQCGGVIATGHPEIVKPLLLASVKREGRPLILPIKADEGMVDPVLFDRKTPPRQREGYKRRWMSRWQT